MNEERRPGTERGAKSGGRDAGMDGLRDHLRRSAPVPPVDEVAWEALARTIGSRAEPLLRARRKRLPWWSHASRWARAGIPLAAAAVLALALLVPRITPRDGAQAPARPEATPTRIATGPGPADATADPLLTFLSAPDDGEALLMSALEEE
jgi:hypothetical protein